MYVNFIDFDSVRRDSLWLIMRSYGIPSKIINMVKALYGDSECAVADGKDSKEWFNIKTGVEKGCNKSGLLFLLVDAQVMRNSLQEGKTRIRWKFTTKLQILLSSTKQHIQTKTDKVIHEAERVGLKVKADKCGQKVNVPGIEEVDRFCVLGGLQFPKMVELLMTSKIE